MHEGEYPNQPTAAFRNELVGILGENFWKNHLPVEQVKKGAFGMRLDKTVPPLFVVSTHGPDRSANAPSQVSIRFF